MSTSSASGMAVAGGAPVLAAGRARLDDILRTFESVCIGYSGGVDSVFLAAAAVAVLGEDRVLAVIGRSPSYPAVHHEVAVSCARRFGIPVLEIETDELSDPRYAANPSDRCYYCKTELWGRLRDVAAARGLQVVLDGSNADDAGDYRPGARAGREQGVRSPLAEAGLGKAEIRGLSRALGLPTWDQPASPCLASRLPYGLPVTAARLAQVEAAEQGLRALGWRECRVRHHGDAARIEAAADELDAICERADEAALAVRRAGFARVLLDVEGYRRGALNEVLGLVRIRNGGRIERAARVLAAAGVTAGLETAGFLDDVLVCEPRVSRAGGVPADRWRVAASAARLRDCGFDYITMRLDCAAGRS